MIKFAATEIHSRKNDVGCAINKVPGFGRVGRRALSLRAPMLTAILVVATGISFAIAATVSAAPSLTEGHPLFKKHPHPHHPPHPPHPKHPKHPLTGARKALWVENSLSATITEFTGDTLTTKGASVPAPNLINESANLFPDTAGVAFDNFKNQWAAVCGNSSGNHGSITKFSAAAVANLGVNASPAANVILSDDGTGTLVSCPWEILFDKLGNLWAANSNEFQVNTAPGFVSEYQPHQFVTGHPKPHIRLTDPTEFVSPTGVLFDSTGNLFVSDFGPGQFGKPGSGAVFVFKAATVASLTPGDNPGVKADAFLFDNTTATPVGGAFDTLGNLWVADCEAAPSGELYMFPKATLTSGASKAAAIFRSTLVTTKNGVENSIDCPGGIAFDVQGNLWYTNFNSLHTNGAVGEFTLSQLAVATGISTPTPNIFLDADKTGTNLSQPIGLTFGPQE